MAKLQLFVRTLPADTLGAQYLWAAGYDPQALIAFFERLEADYEEKPGFFARAFDTHPMTDDCVKRLRRLLDRFPERKEYLLNSSEFRNVQSHAISLGTSHRAGEKGLTV